MADTALQIEKLSKCYRIRHESERHHYTTLRDAVAGKVRKIFGGRTSGGNGQKTIEDFWALKDVSFEVKPGEVVGIIGRNGAGKSTLLKILSRITDPTEGRVRIRGRVASLLEVGTGFHPELTGRENVFLNGAVLGMSRAEIREKFDEIVAFAEIEKFLDTPVKRYSSGMYVRLAFAVAAHLEPEILVVDEVLAVGDYGFQQKCLGKMQDVAAGQGRTVIFVSHNMQAVTTLCSRAVLLNSGRLVQNGPASEVAKSYLQALEGTKSETCWRGDSGDDTVRLKQVRVLGLNSGAYHTDELLRIQMIAEILAPVSGLVFAFEIYSSNRQLLAYTAHDDQQPPPAKFVEPGLYAWELAIPRNTFAAGTYEFRTDIGIHNGKRLVQERIALNVPFENISGVGRRFPSGWTNCFRPDWSWRRLSPEEAK